MSSATTAMSPTTEISPEPFLIGGDLPIHRLGFGTMRLVGEGAWGEPPIGRPAAIRLLRKAVDLGINLLDTADAYGPHIAEELIAEALHPYPAGLVIATKGGLTRTGPAKSKPLGRPDYLTQSVEMSLRRLKLDRIDLYQLHRIDPTVPLEDTLGALRDIHDAGKIRHIGLSEVTPEQITHAQKITPIVSVQNKYNFTERKSEPTLDLCTKNNIAFLPWYPLNAGKDNQRLETPGNPVGDFARQRHLTLAELSLAWLLHRSPVILPIPGTSSADHLSANVNAARITLPDESWQQFDQLLDAQSNQTN